MESKKQKLAEENIADVNENYPKDIWTPLTVLSKQLRWMKEEDFSNQIKDSIKEVFPKRYECMVTSNAKIAKDLIGLTNISIESLKESLRKKCLAKDDYTIAEHIQKNRKGLALLLMADNHREFSINTNPNPITTAVNRYLESNETELDLAIGGMIFDPIKDMQQRKLLNDS